MFYFMSVHIDVILHTHTHIQNAHTHKDYISLPTGLWTVNNQFNNSIDNNFEIIIFKIIMSLSVHSFLNSYIY